MLRLLRSELWEIATKVLVEMLDCGLCSAFYQRLYLGLTLCSMAIIFLPTVLSSGGQARDAGTSCRISIAVHIVFSQTKKNI